VVTGWSQAEDRRCDGLGGVPVEGGGDVAVGVLRVDEYDVLDPALPIVERAVEFRP
jgi:hypothetical protein